MHVNKKELEAVHAAIDFIAAISDVADEDKYPNDILDGLNSLLAKVEKDHETKHFKYLVKRALIELSAKKAVSLT